MEVDPCALVRDLGRPRRRWCGGCRRPGRGNTAGGGDPVPQRPPRPVGAAVVGCGLRVIAVWFWLICRLSAGRFVCGGGNRRQLVSEPWLCPPVVRGARPDNFGPPRALLTSRPARCVTAGVGKSGGSVGEVAEELGCDWHTVNDEVRRWGDALLEADTDRVGRAEAVGVDRKHCSGGAGSTGPSNGAFPS